MEKFKFGVIGADCGEGAELVSLLLRHPMTGGVTVSARGHTGEPYSALFPQMTGFYDDICLSDEEVVSRSDVVFGTPTLKGGQDIAALCVQARSVYIDMSGDFRIRNPELFSSYRGELKYPALLEASVAGLPELSRASLEGKVLVSLPSPVQTACLLALSPLISAELIDPKQITVSAALTGSGFLTGQTDPMCALELEQQISAILGTQTAVTCFNTYVSERRCCFVTVTAKKNLSCNEKTMRNSYEKYYKEEIFVRLLPEGVPVSPANTLMTNVCDISPFFDGRSEYITVAAVLDPYIKGSAGQAVQCMDVLLSMPESLGLELLPANY